MKKKLGRPRQRRSSPLKPHRPSKLAVKPTPVTPTAPIVPSHPIFLAKQVGQLYCMLHEHVQLLLQVFALAARDRSTEIVSKTHQLIVQLLEARSFHLAHYNFGYAFPPECFRPPNTQASVPFHDTALFPPARQQLVADSPVWQHPVADPALLHTTPASTQACPGTWSPHINGSGHAVSVLDVAPLRIAAEFLAEMATELPSLASSSSEFVNRVPLFELAPKERVKSMAPKDGAARTVTRPSTEPVMVPQRIATAMRRFQDLFNPLLLPIRPAKKDFVKRMLFTPAEDRLLALGIERFGADWRKIAQHFFPSKTEHQVAARQKNLCSSRAGDNVVRAAKLKNMSPLTPEELSVVEQRLQWFGPDWARICEGFPYRDHDTLRRLYVKGKGPEAAVLKRGRMIGLPLPRHPLYILPQQPPHAHPALSATQPVHPRAQPPPPMMSRHVPPHAAIQTEGLNSPGRSGQSSGFVPWSGGSGNVDTLIASRSNARKRPQSKSERLPKKSKAPVRAATYFAMPEPLPPSGGHIRMQEAGLEFEREELIDSDSDTDIGGEEDLQMAWEPPQEEFEKEELPDSEDEVFEREELPNSDSDAA
eukprot:jgi/Chlat1/7232/Chrsp57S06763